jgi:hypothetical protein
MKRQLTETAKKPGPSAREELARMRQRIVETAYKARCGETSREERWRRGNEIAADIGDPFFRLDDPFEIALRAGMPADATRIHLTIPGQYFGGVGSPLRSRTADYTLHYFGIELPAPSPRVAAALKVDATPDAHHYIGREIDESLATEISNYASGSGLQVVGYHTLDDATLNIGVWLVRIYSIQTMAYVEYVWRRSWSGGLQRIKFYEQLLAAEYDKDGGLQDLDWARRTAARRANLERKSIFTLAEFGDPDTLMRLRLLASIENDTGRPLGPAYCTSVQEFQKRVTDACARLRKRGIQPTQDRVSREMSVSLRTLKRYIRNFRINWGELSSAAPS